jgi:transcriptional regulator with XRE-family HTH domain
MRDIAAEKAENFVRHMKAERQRRRLSQRQMADLMGLSRQVLVNLELGRKPIRLEEALRYCEAIGTPLQSMISY